MTMIWLAITQWLWLHDYITTIWLLYVIWYMLYDLYTYRLEYIWLIWPSLKMTTTFSHSNRSLSEETARPTLGQSLTAHSRRCSMVQEVLGSLGIEEVSWLQWLIETDTYQLWEHPIFLIFLIGLDYLVWNIGKNQLEITCDDHVWPC